MSENYYNILGINENATKDEIKRAYRSLQMRYHPDKNPGNQECEDMTRKINEAYETLGDEQKRQEYDMMKNNPFMRMNSHNPMEEVPLNDIFNMMFGANPFAMPGMPGMGGMPGMPPGAKIHIFHGGPMNMQQALNKPIPIIKSLQISMEQVFEGASFPLEIERWILQAGSKIIEKETIYVDIPQGIDDNEMIILRDRGNVISEQCKGDIKINIVIQNNTAFKRAGLDLILDKTITLKESLCGFNFELKYINGKSYTLNNNKGSIVPPNYKKIYPGMGLRRGEHKGNMIIQFNIDFPTVLTTEQIDKLSEIL
jgi:DnaJ-class molecular chaperone